MEKIIKLTEEDVINIVAQHLQLKDMWAEVVRSNPVCYPMELGPFYDPRYNSNLEQDKTLLIFRKTTN